MPPNMWLSWRALGLPAALERHQAQGECRARSAKFWMSANTRTLLAPFDKFLVPYWFFFSFLCIWDVAHLNCHPLLPIFNHFHPFSIPRFELSPLWGPREGRGIVAILISPHYGDPKKARVM